MELEHQLHLELVVQMLVLALVGRVSSQALFRSMEDSAQRSLFLLLVHSVQSRSVPGS